MAEHYINMMMCTDGFYTRKSLHELHSELMGLNQGYPSLSVTRRILSQLGGRDWQSLRSPTTKKVNFAMDQNKVYTVPTEENLNKHWGAKMISEFQTQTRHLAANYRHERGDLIDAIEELYESPSETIEKDLRIIEKLADEEDLRGLESRIFNLIRLHRRQAIRSVVRLQKSLRNEPIELVQMLLKARSMHISRKFSDFALRIALVDAMEVESFRTTLAGGIERSAPLASTAA